MFAQSLWLITIIMKSRPLLLLGVNVAYAWIIQFMTLNINSLKRFKRQMIMTLFPFKSILINH